jgi:hypothetical protein
MKIQPLTTHPIVKVKRVKRNDQQRKQEDRQQQRHRQKVEQEDESCRQHIDESI